jgi:hypothetical protein
MLEHSLQKLRSEVHFFACGVPRSLVAVYFLKQVVSLMGVEGRKRKGNYLMVSFPFVTFSVSAIPPRFTLPPYPPHFRQIEHAHSW